MGPFGTGCDTLMDMHTVPFPKGTGKETNDRADDKVTTYVQKSQVHHRCISPLLQETTK